MKLKICWMYHDLMDLYGDKGNIQVLKPAVKSAALNVLSTHVRWMKKRHWRIMICCLSAAVRIVSRDFW